MGPDNSQITPADGALLGRWWRQPPHVIRRGRYAPFRGEGLAPVPAEADVIMPTGEETSWFEPSGDPALLNALLAVAEKRLAPERFADRFGLLGYNHLVPDENKCPGGDPVSWFFAHAQTVHMISDLLAILNLLAQGRGSRAKLAARIADIRAAEIAVGGLTRHYPVPRLAWRPRGGKPVFMADIGVIGQAKEIIRYLVGGNLRGAGAALRQTSGGGFGLCFTYRALVHVVYWQLADQLKCDTMRRCRECGRLFTHPDPRVMFCLPERGKTISRCKGRFTMRRLRSLQRRKK